ncbi:hypothetical protein F0M18_06575 [Pseudohalioglobus sediminis]|uniref:Uncharacterized protein n=1 Tax=Pseudohalioglobus sediminis TaxID=2606449 RepID=A0A5B0X289_9GAMM|nr:hypothetical protein [Pseudohalioglobus sediminis]KAA1193494.1 hypothetical protein F0M18_06575 [Pseudohalioglobus sediminis]
MLDAEQKPAAWLLNSRSPKTVGCQSNDWLGIQPSRHLLAAVNASQSALLSDPMVLRTLALRGIRADLAAEAVRSDLYRMAHAIAALVEHDPPEILAAIIPHHLADTLVNLGYRLNHVGREMLCPVDPLLEAFHRACDALGYCTASNAGAMNTVRGDRVFPSVQVVEAIRREDPQVSAVTIAASSFRESASSEPVYIELFFPGERDGHSAQHAKHMERRLAALHREKNRLVTPPFPICHLSVEVEDYALLEAVHQLGQQDCSGLVTPYGECISVNPGDGSHNTKLAVQQEFHPSAQVNVLEFVFFP